MRPWTSVLTLGLVRWLALRRGERLPLDGRTVVEGPPGVLFTEAPRELGVYLMPPRLDARRRNVQELDAMMGAGEAAPPAPCGLRSRWKCDTCGHDGGHDAPPGCRRQP